jgi:Secretion system C-terminal sorting domain
MKKVLLTLMVAYALQGMAALPNYYSIKSKGVADYELGSLIGLTGIMDRTNNDILTATQTIPFSVSFYGNNYTQFKASDNGYITFDLNATNSVGTNSDIPAGGEPNNCIYAFWNDWEFKAAPNTAFATKITTTTYGVAPNRRFVIQWFGASPKGKAIAANADVLCFGIVLYEGGNGDFDVFFSSYGAASNTGTVGAENSDGSIGYQVAGGSQFAQPVAASTAGADLITYKFFYGIQPARDAILLSCDLPSNLSKATNYTLGGQMANYGTSAITSFDINYSLAGGAAKTRSITGVNIGANGGLYNYSHNIAINEASSGVFKKVKVWISNVNGGADGNNKNDTINTQYVTINGTTAPKKVLFEEATGAWCIHCPDAHSYMANIATQYPNDVILAVHHNNDGMTNAESDAINGAFSIGYPSGYIDRKIQSGQSAVGLNRSVWLNTIATALTDYTPVKVNINAISYNGGTRQVTFTVEAEFSDYYSGDLRIGAMVKEAYIRGAAGNISSGYPYYDQAIASVYTTNPSHEYYNFTSPMGGYYHRNVVINIPSGAWGSAGSMTGDYFSPNQKVSKTFTYTLPAQTSITLTSAAQHYPIGTGIAGRNKPMDISLVGFVSKYNVTASQRNVLNANEQKMWDVANGVVDANATTTDVTAYPNPASGNSVIEFTLPAAQSVIVKVTNSLGQVVQTITKGQMVAGIGALQINTADLANGIYTVSVEGASVSGSTRLIVAH